MLTGVFGKLAAAAVVLGLLVTGYWFFKKPGPAKPGDQTIAKAANDVEAPKGVKAMITLADGRRISLDSLNSGMLVMQGGVEVVKNADQPSGESNFRYSGYDGTRRLCQPRFI